MNAVFSWYVIHNTGSQKHQCKMPYGPEVILWSCLSSVWCQDAQDAYLEQERDRVLTKKLVMIQKAIRGWHYRRKFKKMKYSCVTLQKFYRGFAEKRRYEQVSVQALIRDWGFCGKKYIRHRKDFTSVINRYLKMIPYALTRVWTNLKEASMTNLSSA